MKFKKLLLLPLAALLLNGCAIGKKVDKDVANERVSEATQTQEEMDVDSLFQEAKQDMTESVSQTNLGAETTSKVTNKGTTTLKAKDLLGENPQVVASAKATAKIDKNGQEDSFVSVNENMYYVDGWFYNDYDNKERGNISLAPKSGKGKIKINVGNIDFANKNVLAVFSELSGTAVNFGPVDYSQILLLASITGNVKAREFAGVLTITYNLSKDDLVRFVAAQMAGIDYGDLTSEERELVDAIISEIIAQLEKGYEVRKYVIEVKIAKEGYITKVRVENDVTQTITVPQGMGEDPEYVIVVKSKGFTEINTKLNEKVAIKFPDFSDYVERSLM